MSVINDLKSFLTTRRGAYKGLFKGPLSDIVLSDLAHFCRAHESTFNPNERIAAMLDGRREVWLRIVNHLNLSDEDLFRISTGKSDRSEIPLIDPETYHE